jgi:ubiquinone/menaquinone biosynthesis C-methylase UbiE
MIVAAKQLGAEKDGYILADVQDLSFLRDRSFDLTVSYFKLCDLPDFEANTREVFRVLKRRGALSSSSYTRFVPQLGTG